MRILFGQGTPLPLRAWLAAHHIETARQHGWSELLNGELLAAAEAAGFDLFITTDQNLPHQLDLSRFAIALLVLKIANWPMIERTTCRNCRRAGGHDTSRRIRSMVAAELTRYRSACRGECPLD